MTDLIIQIGVSNLLISLALALVAWGVHSTGKRPLVAHLLWVLVLVKLVTPPILTIPIVPVPEFNTTNAVTLPDNAGLDATSTGMLIPIPDGATAEAGSTLIIEFGKIWVILLWLLGSICVLIWSLLRILRFNRLLTMASSAAQPELQRMASQIAHRLGLKATPTICTTSAHLSPMVWWIGGRVRVVIPDVLLLEMDSGQLQWILAHELAHVRRRDHLVRWLEWLACVGFWWNPVVWWARRNLRINEEICCDALVLSSLHPKPNTYASALMTVVEFLASPAIRPPAMASEINSGGFLERRFKMIISTNRITKTPRWLIAGTLLLAMGLMPLGVAYGQDYNAVGRRLREAVAAGELNGKQARAMIDVLKKSAARSDKTKRNTKSITQKELEVAGLKIRKAVAAGKLSKEEGREKMQGMRRKLGGEARRGERDDRDAGIRPRLAGAANRLRQAVKEGKISGEDARARLGEMRKEMAGNRERSDRRERRITRENFAQAGARLKKLVEEDMITKEEAQNRLRAMRRAIDGERGERRERGEYADRGERDRRRITREDFARAEAEFKKAVEDGKISREDARKRLGEMRKAIAGSRDRDDEIKKRIAGALNEAGIKRGQIRQVMSAMRKIIAEVQSEGNDFKPDPRMLAHLKELGLTGKQIRLTIRLSHRIADTTAASNRGRGEAKRNRQRRGERDSKPRETRKRRE